MPDRSWPKQIRRYSRRQFLKAAALAAAGGLAGCAVPTTPVGEPAVPPETAAVEPTSVDSTEVAAPRPTLTDTSQPVSPIQTSAPEPTPTTALVKPAPDLKALSGSVVSVHSKSAVSWSGEEDYWNYLDQPSINQMVDSGMMALTGKASSADAWKVLFPDYAPGQGIAIKVNFNNTFWGCQDIKGLINALPQPINAVVEGLKKIGVAEQDIWIYDGVNRSITDFFSSGLVHKGVRMFGDCQEGLDYAYDQQIAFHPPAGTPEPDEVYIIDVLVKAKYLINMPIMKNHSCSGVSLAFKNHFGSVNNPGGMHEHVFVTCGSQFSTGYSPLLDLYQNENIGAKTRLTIGDALYGCKGSEDGAPTSWQSFGYNAPSTLFFAVDPVAIDSVMCDYLASEPGGGFAQGSDSYLALASQAGLGVYERGNPRGEGYHKIRYQPIEL